MNNCEDARSRPVPAGPDAYTSFAAAAPCRDLWMIDHNGSTVLRCRCLEASARALRLRVPVGYGVAVGHRYELCAQAAGVPPAPRPGVVAGRWATVKRVEHCSEQQATCVEVLVALDSGRQGRSPAGLTNHISFPTPC